MTYFNDCEKLKAEHKDIKEKLEIAKGCLIDVQRHIEEDGDMDYAPDVDAVNHIKRILEAINSTGEPNGTTSNHKG